jgi:TetR/AcrR family transcriptional regulator
MDEPGSRRGRAHDAEGARQAILDAAEMIFAENGFDGARVDAIAARSGYNKSLIFQYFGDKLNLYSSVIRRMDEETRGMQTQALAELLKEETMSDARHLRGLLRTYLNAYFDYLVDHPGFVRILNWEIAEGWQVYARILNERDLQDLVDFEAPLQKIKESGWLRTNFNPIGQLMWAMFTSHLFLTLLPFFKLFLPDLDFQSKDGLEQARQFMLEFITHGLIATSSEEDK